MLLAHHTPQQGLDGQVGTGGRARGDLTLDGLFWRPGHINFINKAGAGCLTTGGEALVVREK